MPRHRRKALPVDWTVLQIAGVGLLVAAAITLGLVAGAGADRPRGAIVPNCRPTSEPRSPRIPFASGQNINVVVPANAAFADDCEQQHSAIKIVECSAPNGVVPTQTSGL